MKAIALSVTIQPFILEKTKDKPHTHSHTWFDRKPWDGEKEDEGEKIIYGTKGAKASEPIVLSIAR